MIWYASISRPSREIFLHLNDLRAIGAEQTPLASEAEVEAFLSEHPEIEKVMVSSRDFPRRGSTVEKFRPLIRKLFRTR